MIIFNTSLGIDFKENYLILTLLKKTLGRIRLEDCRVHPLGPAGPKEGREAQWMSLISTFISQHGVNKERVSLAIPREKVIVRFIRLPIATKENLRKVLEYESPKYVPFDREEIYFDYQILREDQEWLHLIAVFMKKQELAPYLSLLKRLGIRPYSVQIPSVAALNLFFHHQADKGPPISVLLDSSEPFLEMNLVQQGEWKESFHLHVPPQEKEEKIILTFKRSGLDGDSSSRAKFFAYGFDVAQKKLPALEKTELGKELSPPPMERIEVGKNESRPDYLYASVGIALKGMVKTRLDLNLLPLELRKKVRQIGKPLFGILLSLALILGITWGIGVYQDYQAVLEGLRAEVKKRKPAVEAIEKVQRQRAELAKEVAEYEKIIQGEVSKIEILKELSQILPNSVWIWNVKYSAGEVEISGFADSASDLIPLLDKSSLFEKVEFLAPVTKERDRRTGGEREKERFKIKMRLEGRRASP